MVVLDVVVAPPVAPSLFVPVAGDEPVAGVTGVGAVTDLVTVLIILIVELIV